MSPDEPAHSLAAEHSDAVLGSQPPISGITRRTFIKRTGAVAIVSVLAIGAFQGEAFASDDGGQYYIELTLAEDQSIATDEWDEVTVTGTHRFRLKVIAEVDNALHPPNFAPPPENLAQHSKKNQLKESWEVKLVAHTSVYDMTSNYFVTTINAQQLSCVLSLNGDKTLSIQASGGKNDGKDGWNQGSQIVVTGNNTQNAQVTCNVRSGYTNLALENVGARVDLPFGGLTWASNGSAQHDKSTNLAFGFAVRKV